MKLNPNTEQRKVIEHSDGPLLVIAGPGSGETFTLVERATGEGMILVSWRVGAFKCSGKLRDNINNF